VIRKEILDFIRFGRPDNIANLSEQENETFLDLFEKIFELRPVSDEEALLLAHSLGKDDLDGIGSLVCAIIASASMWPSDKFFYINNFSDPLTYLKRSAIFSGEVFYTFTSENNKKLVMNHENFANICFNLQEGLSTLDLQMILSAFWLAEKKDINSLLIDYLNPILQKCIKENNITSEFFSKESVSRNMLNEVFSIEL
jgi:hypothetical protein